MQGAVPPHFSIEQSVHLHSLLWLVLMSAVLFAEDSLARSDFSQCWLWLLRSNHETSFKSRNWKQIFNSDLANISRAKTF